MNICIISLVYCACIKKYKIRLFYKISSLPTNLNSFHWNAYEKVQFSKQDINLLFTSNIENFLKFLAFFFLLPLYFETTHQVGSLKGLKMGINKSNILSETADSVAALILRASIRCDLSGWLCLQRQVTRGKCFSRRVTKE